MKNEVDTTNRRQLENALIEAERLDLQEAKDFTLEELKYFWLIYLFESRKQNQESENSGE
jgi:hypothetical protein